MKTDLALGSLGDSFKNFQTGYTWIPPRKLGHREVLLKTSPTTGQENEECVVYQDGQERQSLRVVMWNFPLYALYWLIKKLS